MAGPSKKLTYNKAIKPASHEIEELARKNVLRKVCYHGHLENTTGCAIKIQLHIFSPKG